MTTTLQPTDAELVAQAQGGDELAFRELVMRYQGPVFGCARAITRHDADAKDAAQEAFIRFHRNLSQYDPRRPLKPYLLTIAANCSRSLLSRRKRLAQVDDPELALAQVADAEVSVSARLVKGERHAAIRGLVDALPQTMREVCSLFYLSGCSCRETAEILNMSESAVKVSLFRARKKLQDLGAAQWRTP